MLFYPLPNLSAYIREETLERDQELCKLLLIGKRSLLAMRPANGGGEEKRLRCLVVVYAGGGRKIDGGGRDR
jgi:hypothetical protein